MSQYLYTKSPCSLDSIIFDVQHSSIVTALDLANTNLFGDQLTVCFMADLSDPDKSTLDSLVSNNDGQPLPVNTAQPVSIENPVIQVTTQFEAKDKTLKLASVCAENDSEGVFTLQLKIPGTPGSANGRWLSGGMAWFSHQDPDDRISSVRFVDVDGVLGTPNTVIGSYTDEELDEPNQGWRIPQPRGMIEVETLGFYGFAPAGFWIVITGISGNGFISGKKMYVNFEWGKTEV